MSTPNRPAAPSLAEVVREWTRIGCVGFGGPPAHMTLLRELCVSRRAWLSEEQFERAIAATNLLPGPSSTQLAIYCAWGVRGNLGALVGGVCFILPGLAMILALSVLFLAGSPPTWVRGTAMGAGAAVAAGALRAGLTVPLPIWSRAHARDRPRVLGYALVGGLAAAVTGPWLVFALLACGAAELALRAGAAGAAALAPLPMLVALTTKGNLAALTWTALKVGGLAFGGGFVIVPLMQGDAVGAYHWMTRQSFLSAVALGQITPGPVVHTVAAVGYAAGGVPAALLASAVAF
ncbi:MAG: chromate transporter, partial [Acidobacteriota bacterium]|nr:chromate transporter [Acidobacteriota bacterium]